MTIPITINTAFHTVCHALSLSNPQASSLPALLALTLEAMIPITKSMTTNSKAIRIRVCTGDKVANFTMSLAEPHIELSAENVWLLPENNNMEFVDLKSNLHWKFVF